MVGIFVFIWSLFLIFLKKSSNSLSTKKQLIMVGISWYLVPIGQVDSSQNEAYFQNFTVFTRLKQKRLTIKLQT